MSFAANALSFHIFAKDGKKASRFLSLPSLQMRVQDTTKKNANPTWKSIYILIGFSFDCRVLIKYPYLFEHWI